MAMPDTVNQRWSLDFASDTLADGRRFRILCVVDDFSRECLAGLFNAQFMKRIARRAPMPPKAMRCLASVTL